MTENLLFLVGQEHLSAYRTRSWFGTRNIM